MASISDEAKMLNLSKIQDTRMHNRLRDDLVEHHWATTGDEIID